MEARVALHDDNVGLGMSVLGSRIRAARVPRAQADNLRLATWNIRRFGEGKRLPESIEMIAAIIRAFDLVAIVELCDDVSDLRRVLKALGKNWTAVFSDYLRDAAGNRERIGFVFDTTRVRFTGLASTVEGERRLVSGHYVEAVPRAAFRQPGYGRRGSARPVSFRGDPTGNRRTLAA